MPLTLAALLPCPSLLIVESASAEAFVCGAAGDRAATARRWHEAATAYQTDADDPRCASLRAIYLHNAAMSAQAATRAGTPAERCAIAERFRRVLSADPPAQLARAASEGLTAATAYCTGPSRADSAPLVPPAPPVAAQLIAETLPEVAPAPLPALSVQSGVGPAAGDFLYGAGAVSLAGAAVALVVHLIAADERDDALDLARATADPAPYQRRFEVANERANTSGVTTYALLALGAGLFGTGLVFDLMADDEPSTPHGWAARDAVGQR